MTSSNATRVFFFLSGGWGPLVRTLPIITRLAEHGIASSVSVAGLAPRLRDAGFDVIEPAVPAFGAPAEAAPGWWSPYHFLVHHGHDIKRIVAHVEAYRKTIQDGKPCVVVTDINPAAALAARSLQAIHFTISQSLFLPFRNLTSSRWRLPAAALPVINEVLQHYGFAAIQTAEHLDVGDVTFLPSIPEFDPLDDPPSSVQYAGPILGNRLIPFAPSAERPCATRPWILFYPGRPHDAAGRSGQTLFDVGLQALSAVTARVTVATGGHDFAIPQQAQARFEIVPWHVLSSDGKPDLMVHHGGHGSCLTAISAGIPSVVVPTHAEREYNARNLVALGCGEMLLSPEPDALRLREAVENVLETPGYAAKCAQWSRTIAEREYGGPDLVVRMIMQTTAGITCAGAP